MSDPARSARRLRAPTGRITQSAVGRCPEEESNLYVPERTGGFKPPASAVPPPGPRPTLRGGRDSRVWARARDGVEQCAPNPGGGRFLQGVRDDHAFHHVGQHFGERPIAQDDGDHGATGEPADRARGSGAARRRPERRNRQPRRTRRGAEAACRLGKEHCRRTVHHRRFNTPPETGCAGRGTRH